MIKMMFRVSAIGIMFLAILGIMTLLGSPIWWLALPMAVCAYMMLILVLKTLFKTAVLVPFKMKGAVLRGARFTVHCVELAEPPSLDEEEDEYDEFDDDEGPRAYYRVDISITPTASSTSMTYWEPGELILVPKAVKSDAEIWDELEEAGYVQQFGQFFRGVAA